MDQAQSLLLVEAAAKRCRDSGSKRFTDSHFPADPSALRHDWNRNGLGPPPLWTEVLWRRLPSATAKRVVVFPTDIRPGTLALGPLADPPFSCALALLSTRPELLRLLFVTQEPSPLGLYAVRLCKNGSWRTVLVDDSIPYHGVSGGAAFLSTTDGSVWAAILEKAWAKVHGSYQAAARGYFGDTLRDLTGAPTEPLTWETPELRAELPAALTKALEKGWLVGAVARARVAQADSHGRRHLLEGFIYPLTGASAGASAGAKAEGWVQLTDPWGRGDGGRVDSAEDTTDGAVDGDRSFKMDFATFFADFSSVYICRCDPSWVYKSSRVDVARGKPAAVEMVLSQPARVVVSLDHRDRQCVRGPASAVRYPDLSLSVCRAGSKGEALAVRSCVSARDVWAAPQEEELPAGTYHVVAEAHEEEAGGKGPVLALSVYSSAPVELNQSQANASALLSRALARRAVKQGETSSPLGIKGLSRKVWQGPNGLLVFTWRNSSADLLLRDTVTVHHLTLNGWEVEGMPQSPAQREASLAAAAGAAAAGAGVGFGDVKAVAAELVAAVGASSEEEEAASRHRAMGAAASSGASGEGLGSPQGAEGDVAGAKKGADEMLVQRFVVEVGPGKAATCFLRRKSTKNGFTLPEVPVGSPLAQMCPIESAVFRVQQQHSIASAAEKIGRRR